MLKKLIVPFTALACVIAVFVAIALHHDAPHGEDATRPVPPHDTAWGKILAGPDLPKTPEPSAYQQARWKQERAAAQEREQEHQAAASALVTHCRRHIQGQYVSPEEMRAFTRCIDGQ